MNKAIRTAVLMAAILTLFGVSSSAQVDQEPLSVYAGSIVFNNPAFDPDAVIDFPFTIKRHELEFYRPDSSIEEVQARVFAVVIVYGMDGLPMDSSNTYFSVKAASAKNASDNEMTLFNRLSVLAKPGIYTARLTVIDVVSKREGDFFMDRVIVEPPSSTRLYIGAKTLAYGITRVEDSTQIDRNVRNGYRILANPLSIFSVNDSTINLYAELYNLTFDGDEQAEYLLGYSVLDSKDSLFLDLGVVKKHKPGGAAVIVQEIDIGAWRYGDYTIRLVASDPESGDIDTALFPFRLFPPAKELAELVKLSMADPYDTLSAIDKEHLIRYLLVPDEAQTLKMLSPHGRLNFMDQYWRENDSDPNTPAIENRLEMISRYDYVQSHFSTNVDRTDGWNSDRGRIYMTIGPWEERVDIQVPNMGDPYVVWYYYTIKEGVLFVFEDRDGMHDYRLVHSTKAGERFDRIWETKLAEDVYKR